MNVTRQTYGLLGGLGQELLLELVKLGDASVELHCHVFESFLYLLDLLHRLSLWFVFAFRSLS